jgi:L-lysine 2,3-aminomutase
VLACLKKIQKLGIPVMNQWVLLRGVNDTIDILQELCEKLVDYGIFPYYLHQLDRVEGAAHFEVSPDEGRALIHALNQRLAGYAIPKYVQEIPGEPSKSLII